MKFQRVAYWGLPFVYMNFESIRCSDAEVDLWLGWQGDCVLRLRGRPLGNGDCRSVKGEMGKGWTIVAAKFAGKIDRRRLGALAVLILESVLVSVLLSSYNYGYSPRNSTAGKISATAAADPGATESDWFAAVPVLEKTDRVIYPYSVIPGGIRNSAELRNAVAHDDTVAQHYADFNLRNARVMQLRENSRCIRFLSHRQPDLLDEESAESAGGGNGGNGRRAHGQSSLWEPAFGRSHRAGTCKRAPAGSDGNSGGWRAFGGSGILE